MMEKLILPQVLTPHSTAFENTLRPYVQIRTVAAEAMAPEQSKFGGLPCFPQEKEYPMDDKRRPMLLLAQINFGELPRNNLLPGQGLLQFFLADNSMYGLDLERPTLQYGFRVLYWDSVPQQAVTDFSFLSDFENAPITRSYTLEFMLSQAPVGLEDMHFEKAFGQSSYAFFKTLGPEGASARKEYLGISEARGHKMGGYAHFNQEDPRWMQESFADALLLLQLDSDGEGICFGDRGTAQFFIQPQDLQQKDFSRVLYNWDSP